MTIPIKTWSSRIIIVLFSVLLVLGIGSPVFAASLSGNWQIIESRVRQRFLEFRAISNSQTGLQ